jgi:hypothetical protein
MNLFKLSSGAIINLDKVYFTTKDKEDYIIIFKMNASGSDIVRRNIAKEDFEEISKLVINP